MLFVTVAAIDLYYADDADSIIAFVKQVRIQSTYIACKPTAFQHKICRLIVTETRCLRIIWNGLNDDESRRQLALGLQQLYLVASMC